MVRSLYELQAQQEKLFAEPEDGSFAALITKLPFRAESPSLGERGTQVSGANPASR